MTGITVTEDKEAAVEWFSKAADQDFGPAQKDLGIACQLGEGTPKNYTHAVYWFRKASKLGLPEAHLHLGVAYANGEGVPTDFSLAYSWCFLAKLGGDPQATDALKQIGGNLGWLERYKAGRLARRKFFSNEDFDKP